MIDRGKDIYLKAIKIRSNKAKIRRYQFPGEYYRGIQGKVSKWPKYKIWRYGGSFESYLGLRLSSHHTKWQTVLEPHEDHIRYED